jgi:hypothetical protein
MSSTTPGKPALRLVPPPEPVPDAEPASGAHVVWTLVWAVCALFSLVFGFLSDASAQAAEAAGKLGGE